MEEIVFEDAFGGEYTAMAFAVMDAIMEKSRNNGVQIGIPWSKPVYDYLFESEAGTDIEELLEILSAAPGQTGAF